MFKGSKNAFTLAEVLITLGIIGVVAAMTMPTLLNSTQAARSKTGFKKVMNVLNQALVVNYALEDLDAGQASSGTEEGSLYNIFKSRTNVVRETVENDNYVLFFNDGMTFEFPQAAHDCTADANKGVGTWSENDCIGIIDTIGGRKINNESAKGPNKITEAVTNSGEANAKVRTEDIYDQWLVNIIDDKVEPGNEAARLIMYNK